MFGCLKGVRMLIPSLRAPEKLTKESQEPPAEHFGKLENGVKVIAVDRQVPCSLYRNHIKNNIDILYDIYRHYHKL